MNEIPLPYIKFFSRLQCLDIARSPVSPRNLLDILEQCPRIIMIFGSPFDYFQWDENLKTVIFDVRQELVNHFQKGDWDSFRQFPEKYYAPYEAVCYQLSINRWKSAMPSEPQTYDWWFNQLASPLTLFEVTDYEPFPDKKDAFPGGVRELDAIP
mmetsp:Transcript_21825/g.38402  ORF Transcript_21825/g.38402 Transcript_21825/m.38402 type:complete len:155 (+) Transcript_21825:3-467(+)